MTIHIPRQSRAHGFVCRLSSNFKSNIYTLKPFDMQTYGMLDLYFLLDDELSRIMMIMGMT